MEQNNRIPFKELGLIAVVVLLSACLGVTQGESEAIAREYLAFERGELTLIESASLPCSNCYLFGFVVNSKTYSVVVKDGNVVEVVRDGTFNVIEGKIIDTNTRSIVFHCLDPRPDVCSEEYKPVCGDDGHDYGNGCTACAEKDVRWYVEGICGESSIQRADKDLRSGKLTSDSGPAVVVVGWNLNQGSEAT